MGLIEVELVLNAQYQVSETGRVDVPYLSALKKTLTFLDPWHFERQAKTPPKGVDSLDPRGQGFCPESGRVFQPLSILLQAVRSWFRIF